MSSDVDDEVKKIELRKNCSACKVGGGMCKCSALKAARAAFDNGHRFKTSFRFSEHGLAFLDASQKANVAADQQCKKK